MTIEVVEDPARGAAAMMISAALGGGEIVLAGGSTPRSAYEQFVTAVRTVGLDLSRTRFWIGDDRCVGPENEVSNYRMIQESLLGPLAAVSRPVIHRIRGELGPEAGANDYERQLRDAGTPKFDLVLLGMGPDGHTASLFPDQGTLSERERLVVGVPEAGLEPFVPRVTMTFPALANSRDVLVLAEGGSKADAVAAAFGPEAKPDPHVPSSMLVSEVKNLTVLLDHEAAAKLPDGGGE
jgi:6-phosphogluconolactonase